MLNILLRISIHLTSERYIPVEVLNKYYVQSAIYSLLLGTEHSELHDSKHFKFFSFSDFFPAGPFFPHKGKTIVISSPDVELIDFLFTRLDRVKCLYFLGYRAEIEECRKFDMRGKVTQWQTGSPITLYKNNRDNLYFSFTKGDNVDFFLERLKDNALRKYRVFADNPDFTIIGNLFDRLMFKKEVSMLLTRNGEAFNIIGSVWAFLKKTNINREQREFYEFLFDAGLGEKNSLGFGFVNPVKRVSL